MRFSSLGRFLLVAIASLLCLMPLWYYLAPQIAKPVFFLAGEAAGAAFRWVQGYDVKETVGTLNTQLKMVSVQNGQLLLGKLAPLVDYRMLGYGVVIFWALVLASLPRGWLRKLLIGSAIMLPVQALNVVLQWCNDVFNRAGPEAFAQTGMPGFVADAVAFLYHFNLFIFTALAPVLLWLLLDREFLAKLVEQARAAVAAQRAP